MEKYTPRKIEFRELVVLNEWQIKTYTISLYGTFDHPGIYKNILGQLPSWLEQQNSFDTSNDKIAFLIIHDATEGIFSIINWWTGKNMLNSHIFITKPEQPNRFKKISGDGLAPCIWELEIIYHEKVSWTENVLKQLSHPDYKKYLEEVINIEI